MERQLRINWPAIVEEAKQRRNAQKLTQQRLATLAGVSAPTISRFESGEEHIEIFSVLNILKVLGMVDKRSLHFPDPNPHYEPIMSSVIFWGQDGEKRVKCTITRAALDDHFGGNRHNYEKIFEVNQTAIEHIARKKYLANELDADGTIAELTIQTEDI